MLYYAEKGDLRLILLYLMDSMDIVILDLRINNLS